MRGERRKRKGGSYSWSAVQFYSLLARCCYMLLCHCTSAKYSVPVTRCSLLPAVDQSQQEKGSARSASLLLCAAAGHTGVSD